jgi:hypothetical protein
VSQGELFDRERPERKRRSYHVRAHQTVGEVQAGEAKARGQEAEVLALFRFWGPRRLTPWEVQREMEQDGHRMLITSVRRALTNLTQKGLLRRHDEDRRPGEAGALNATWSLP